MQRENRRLAAIVAADIAGYSRLIGRDEEGTLRSLRAHRAELIDPAIDRHGGRIANTAGDSLLLEFASAVDAVRCAIAVQEGMAERNNDIEADRRIIFRIGINVGDVVAQGEDLLGDGVNVAARLEGLAEPGGLTLSDDAHRQVRDRLDVQWRDTGEHEVKNIVRPVHVWHWSTNVEEKTGNAPSGGKPLSLPDKPSIAVLPFDNMSGDSEQEYFSDGMTEDIITALSRLRWLFVIARNSSFTYKGRAVDVTRVGRELGVRYVLEGSVRKAGQRIRVTVQLIEAETGNHIWAERYDRDLVDIFDLQDELTRAISAQVNTELAISEQDLAHNKPTTDLNTWDLYQRGLWHLNRRPRTELVETRRLFGQALERSPDFAIGHAALAHLALLDVINGRTDDLAAALQNALNHAERAMSLDNRDSFNHYVLGRIHSRLGHEARAISMLRKSIEINPNLPRGHFGLAHTLFWFGHAEASIEPATLAIRLSPMDPDLDGYYGTRSIAYYMVGDWENAIMDADAASQLSGAWFYPYLARASIFGELDRIEEARAAYAEALERNPQISINYLRALWEYLHPPYVEKCLAGLYKAGLPEE